MNQQSPVRIAGPALIPGERDTYKQGGLTGLPLVSHPLKGFGGGGGVFEDLYRSKEGGGTATPTCAVSGRVTWKPSSLPKLQSLTLSVSLCTSLQFYLFLPSLFLSFSVCLSVCLSVWLALSLSFYLSSFSLICNSSRQFNLYRSRSPCLIACLQKWLASKKKLKNFN